MGNCTKIEGSKFKDDRIAWDRFDAEPDDTANFVGKNLPALTFHALLRKVKIKNALQVFMF